MIEQARANQIAADILPRIRKFPRGQSALASTLAECGKLLADRCKTPQQAEDFCQSYQQPGEWIGVPAFRAALESATSIDIPLNDQRSLAGLVRNSITEPLRCGDKLIGWCGRPFPSELVSACSNFEVKPLHEQALLGQRVIAATTQIEAEVWADILGLSPDQRAQLEAYARKEWPGEFARAWPDGNPRWAQCLVFEEWRNRECE